MSRSIRWRADRLARRAAGYDRDGLAALLSRVRTQALHQLNLVPGDRFLDVACSTGVALHTLPEGVQAIGVDLSPSMIDQARRLSPDSTQCAFIVADAEHLPFAPDTFSAILCASALHYFERPAQAVREMARVLRPDGRVVVAGLERLAGREDFSVACPPRRALEDTDLVLQAELRLPTALGMYSIVVATSRSPGASPPSRRFGFFHT